MATTYTVAIGTAWVTVVEASTITVGNRFVTITNLSTPNVVLSNGTVLGLNDDLGFYLDAADTFTARSPDGAATLQVEDEGTVATFDPVGRQYDVRNYGTFTPASTAAVNTATIKAAVAAAYAAGGGDIYVPRAATGYPVARSNLGSSLIGAINLLPGVGLVSDGAQLILQDGCSFVTAFSTLSTTATTTITVNTVATTTAFTVASSTNFVVGDDVFVRLGDRPADAAEPDHWMYAKVLTIPDATHLTIDRPCGYVLTVASAGVTNKTITRVDDWVENVSIGDLDLYNPMTGSANAEYGVRLANARNIHIGTITGQDPGAGLICGQFTENVEVDLIGLRQCTAQNGHTSKGRGIALAECRNWHFNSVRLQDCQSKFVVLESSCDAIRIDNLLVDNGYAGRSTTSTAVLSLNYYCNLDVGVLNVIGNTTYVGPDTSAQAGSALTIGDAHLYTSGAAYSNLSIDNVRAMLTLGGTTYNRPRTWTKRIALTANMSDVTVAAPAGYWRSCRIYASNTTGVTAFYVFSAIGGSNYASTLVSGTSVALANIGSTTQNHNAGTAKAFHVYTDGTLVASSYLIVEVDYFEDPTSIKQTVYDTTGLLQ